MNLRLMGGCLLVAAVLPFSVACEPLNQAFIKAWAIYPQIRVLDAQVNEVEAKARATERLFFEAPSVGVAYSDDGLTSNTGKSSQEIFVELPLWQPGLRDAVRNTVDASSAQLGGERQFHRWQLAGELRRRYWDLARASVQVKSTKQRVITTERLLNDVKKRLEAGDLSQADYLLAQGEFLAVHAQAADANRIHNLVALAYQALTGDKTLPDAESETLRTSVTSDHPALFNARLAVEVAHALLREVKAEERDTPSLKIVYEREREKSFEPSVNSIGLEFELPLGTSSRNKPRITAALVQLNVAKASQILEHRNVNLAQAQAQTAYQQAVDALNISEQRSQLIRQHYQLALKSFDAGELSLVELLRFKQNADEITQEANLLRIEEASARSTLNQAMGFLP